MVRGFYLVIIKHPSVEIVALFVCDIGNEFRLLFDGIALFGRMPTIRVIGNIDGSTNVINMLNPRFIIHGGEILSCTSHFE